MTTKDPKDSISSFAATPRPWKVYHEINIEAENGRQIGSFGVATSFDESKANAEYICKAVNNYEALEKERDAMLKALERIKSQCAGHADEFSGNVWRIAESALTLSVQGKP